MPGETYEELLRGGGASGAAPATEAGGETYDQLLGKHPNTIPTKSDWTLPVLAAGAVGAGAYALTRNPEAAKRIGQSALDLRQVSMLSGLAPLKSFLGNIGAAAYGSIERESIAPLKAFFSGETVNDFKQAWKSGAQYFGDTKPSVFQKLNVPGRFMGAMDTASKNALVRSGFTPEESAIEMLQRPLPPELAKAVQHPVGRYVMPFRQIPINQPFEGIRTWRPENLASTGQKVANAASVGQGFVTGYNTQDPTLLAGSVAAGGKRGINVGAGEALGILAKTGSSGQARQGLTGMSPLSEYGLSESVLQPVTDPLKPITQPAAVTAYHKLRTLLGLD